MKKYKIINPSHEGVKKLFDIIFLYTRSIEDISVIINQFNRLSSKQRTIIANEYNTMEAETKITSSFMQNLGVDFQTDDSETEFKLICNMVNFHIIATKHNIDPATVALCLYVQQKNSSLCKKDELLKLI